MADQRTIRRVLHGLAEGRKPQTKIKGYRYHVECDELGVLVVPSAGGDTASSCIEHDSPEYEQGGAIFRMAVDLAKAIDEARRLKLRGAVG